MTDELRPLRECPFCGGEAGIDRFTNGNEFRVYQPMCSRCSCTLGGTTKDENDAINAWNNRTPDPRLEKALLFISALAEFSDDDYSGLSIEWAHNARELLKELSED